MPERLTDARDTTFGDADELLQRIFNARLAILRREAAAEKEISEIRERLRVDTADARMRLELSEAKLSAFIMANREEFTKPRMRSTPFGMYGLRSSSRVSVDDEAAVLAWAKENGYCDVIRIEECVVKPAVTKRLRAGQDIPGCSIEAGEASEYKLDTAALEAEL